MTGPEAARLLLASRLLRRLASAWSAGQLFLTGGSLRDLLMGLPTRDIDLAVLGDPRAAGGALARVVGGRCFPLGRPPLVTWRVAGGRYTIDLWGVHGDVEADILRRDFTINALFWRLPRGPLVDLVGGLDDLAAGRIRVVRPANLLADPLRVLRGVRMLATHPRMRLTADSEEHLAAAAAHLRGVARQRVADELRAMLGGPGAGRAVLAASRLGALPALLPEWHGYRHAAPVARIAGELAAARAGGGPLAPAACEVAGAVLAAPAAGHPDGWDAGAAARALTEVGWPPREARHSAGGAGVGETLLPLLGGDVAAQRELGAEHPEHLAAGIAWATARAAASGGDVTGAGIALLRWSRRFAGRPPLLSGEEVATMLALGPGPARGEAVNALRRAQARGEVRTSAQARRYLRERGLR